MQQVAAGGRSMRWTEPPHHNRERKGKKRESLPMRKDRISDVPSHNHQIDRISTVTGTGFPWSGASFSVSMPTVSTLTTLLDPVRGLEIASRGAPIAGSFVAMAAL